MKKLKLNVDELVVVSFEATDAAGGGRGTVHGHAKATQETCGCTAGWDTCDTQYDTCGDSCGWAGSCYAHSCGWDLCTETC